MARIWVIHGPNLNLLGTREPELYGTTTLAELDAILANRARELGHELVAVQSNSEGELVTWIQEADAELIIINPGGYTHTSVAIRDALLARGVPTIEVHITNPEAREPFRRVSLISDVVAGRVTGLGIHSYEVALIGGLKLLEERGASVRRGR